MAFVARNDRHGNEIMRVMLSAEPGRPTVASCHNLRINCVPQQPPATTTTSEGRFDHRQRFHYYADDEAPSLAASSHSGKELLEKPGDGQEQQQQQQQPEETQSHKADESTTVWHSGEISAHSTLLDPSKSHLEKSQPERRRNFHSWLAAKNEAQLQQAEDRRLVAQQQDQRATERARLASQHFQNWCQTKSNNLRRAKSDMSSLPVTPASPSTQSTETQQQQQRRNVWECAKLAELKAQREQRKAKDIQQQLIESSRRELSAEAWEQWMDASRTKPRPVPMGKGLESLRASMAPLYTNPNEWQTLLPTTSRKQQQQLQQQQQQQQQQLPSTAGRGGPDYERLERLAQPRRQQRRQATGNGSQRRHDGQSGDEDLELDGVSNESGDQADATLQRRGKPIVWSTRNAQRVRELREVLNPLDEPPPCPLRDDQLEQLRQQQDLQNTKVLPRKYQQKRDQLREKLKPWVEAGKLQPEIETQLETLQRSEHRRDSNCSPVQRTRSHDHDPLQLLRQREAKAAPKNKPWR